MNKMWISKDGVFISEKGSELCSCSGDLHGGQCGCAVRGQALEGLVIYQDEKKIAMECVMGLPGDTRRSNVHCLVNVRL